MLLCFILYILSLTTVYSKLAMKRPPQTPPAFKPLDGKTGFPSNFRLRDMPSLRVPSNRFCKEQQLRGPDLFMLLPWWYMYCLEHKDRHNKKYDGPLRNLHYYQEVLRRVKIAKEKNSTQLQ